MRRTTAPVIHDPPELLTKDEAAALLRRSPKTLSHWRLNGEGPPAFRVGRRLFYLRADLIKWLAEQQEEGRS
jgi:hypothetical protein